MIKHAWYRYVQEKKNSAKKTSALATLDTPENSYKFSGSTSNILCDKNKYISVWIILVQIS